MICTRSSAGVTVMESNLCFSNLLKGKLDQHIVINVAFEKGRMLKSLR